MRRKKPTTLEELLKLIAEAPEEDSRVSLEAIVSEVGRRSFGPLLLVTGLVTLSPIGDVPGMPTLMAIVVLLIAGQLLAGREQFWLPRWLLARSVAKQKLEKAVKWLRRPARFVDRLLRPRLHALVGKPGTRAIAAVCLVIAAAMPVMEFVPFSATAAGLALCAFGLAIIAEDGLIALLAMIFTAATVAAVATNII